MRLTLKVNPAGTGSLAFSYLAPGASPGFSVVEVCQIPHGTPAAEVLAAYSQRIVNVHPYGPFRVSWPHLVKLGQSRFTSSLKPLSAGFPPHRSIVFIPPPLLASAPGRLLSLDRSQEPFGLDTLRRVCDGRHGCRQIGHRLLCDASGCALDPRHGLVVQVRRPPLIDHTYETMSSSCVIEK